MPAPLPFSKSFPRDLLASLVVFMVALPLCIAIAKACGLSAEAGIVTGIIGGIVVGFFAGSPFQVSGPAAGLIVLVLEFVNHHREMIDQGETTIPVAAALGVAILIAGLLQILMAILKLGLWFRAVSPAVVLGMLGGIGVVIFAKQIHVMIDDKPSASIVENLQSIPNAVWKVYADADPNPPHHRGAATAGLVTLCVLILWNTILPRKWRVIPGAIIAVVAGSLVAESFGLFPERVNVSSNLLDGLTWFHFSTAEELLQQSAVWKMGFAIALIASAETLLCATAVDQMHNGPRTQYNRELFAQGIGNSLCGLVGALPLTGVIVRSSANVSAGAKTRLSTIMHGIWLLLFVSLLPSVLKFIPEACLAAVLVYTGFKLLELKSIKRLWNESPGEVGIFLVTLIGVVTMDLLLGVLMGIGLTIAKLLWTMSQLEIRVVRNDPERSMMLVLRGAATFVSLPKLADALDRLPRDYSATVRMEEMSIVDHSCWRLLQDWEKQRGGDGFVEWNSPKPVEVSDKNLPKDVPTSKEEEKLPVLAFPDTIRFPVLQ